MLLKIKKEHPDVPTPTKAHKDDAGMDLRAWMPPWSHGDGIVTLAPGHRALIPTGLRFGIPKGFEIQIRPRSGLALNHGITIVNSPGTIDAGYIGPVGVIMINLGQEDFVVKHGERICQAVVMTVPDVDTLVVDDLEDSERGAAGYGSTGML